MSGERGGGHPERLGVDERGGQPEHEREQAGAERAAHC